MQSESGPTTTDTIIFVGGRTETFGMTTQWMGVGPTPRQLRWAEHAVASGVTVRLPFEPNLHLPEEIVRLALRSGTGTVVADGDLSTSVLDALVDTFDQVIDARDQSESWYWSSANINSEHQSPLEDLAAPRSVIAQTGIEVAWESGDDVAQISAGALADRIAALDHSELGVPVVLLHGMDLLDAPALEELLVTLSEAAPTHFGCAGTVAPASVVELSTPDALSALSVVALRYNTGDCLDTLDDALFGLSTVPADQMIAAELTASTRDVEDLVDLALQFGTPIEFEWSEAVDDTARRMAEVALADAGGQTMQKAQNTSAMPYLDHLFSGTALPEELKTTGPQAIWCEPEVDRTNLALVGPRTPVFIGDEVDPLSGEHSLALSNGPDLPGRGGVDGLRFELASYAAARHREPMEPTLLCMLTAEDVEAFLADADHARETGEFPFGLVHPFTMLADTDVWESTTSATVSRLRITSKGEARLGMRGPVVTSSIESWRQVSRAGQHVVAERREARGCATCPVAAVCSKGLGLASLLSDADYCRARQERPWLGHYMAAIKLLRQVPNGARVGQVSGFGFTCNDELGENWTSQNAPSVLVAQVGEQTVGASQDGSVLFMLGTDAARIAEICAGSDSLATAVELTVEALSVSDDVASGAIDVTLRSLAERGVSFPRMTETSVPEHGSVVSA